MQLLVKDVKMAQLTASFIKILVKDVKSESTALSHTIIIICHVSYHHHHLHV